jgi:hypothetical protein
MKNELKSESQAETGRGGKIRKSPFFRLVCFSAILPPGRKPWSAVKPGQTESNRFSWSSWRPESMQTIDNE